MGGENGGGEATTAFEAIGQDEHVLEGREPHELGVTIERRRPQHLSITRAARFAATCR